jgi:RNA polymerase sigma-70 factor (ECF subfamily)
MTNDNISAATGNQDEFIAQAEQHRREIQVHCYRILGSVEEAEDLVQETMLRAWRSQDKF